MNKKNRRRFPIRAMNTLKKSMKDGYMKSVEGKLAEKGLKLRLLTNGGAPRPINPQKIPTHIEVSIMKTGKQYITRNSACPCGSFKRYKRCCAQEV